MKKIFWGFIFLSSFLTSNVFSAEWLTKQGQGPKFYEDLSGYVTKDTSICKRIQFNQWPNEKGIVGQGVKKGYSDSTKSKLLQISKGKFDCQNSPSGLIVYNLIEGYDHNVELGAYRIIYKTDDVTKYIYLYENSNWTSMECPLDYSTCTIVYKKVAMTPQEINQAKLIINFYDNLRLDSPNTPYYGNNFPRPTFANATQAQIPISIYEPARRDGPTTVEQAKTSLFKNSQLDSVEGIYFVEREDSYVAIVKVRNGVYNLWTISSRNSNKNGTLDVNENVVKTANENFYIFQTYVYNTNNLKEAKRGNGKITIQGNEINFSINPVCFSQGKCTSLILGTATKIWPAAIKQNNNETGKNINTYIDFSFKNYLWVPILLLVGGLCIYLRNVFIKKSKKNIEKKIEKKEIKKESIFNKLQSNIKRVFLSTQKHLINSFSVFLKNLHNIKINFLVLRKLLGIGFILLGLIDFAVSFAGINLTPFLPRALSKFTPIIFGFIGGLLLKQNSQLQNNEPQLENNGIIKKAHKKLTKFNIYPKKNKIFLISSVVIFFSVIVVGYILQQNKINQDSLIEKTENERIAKNKQESLELRERQKRESQMLAEEIKNKIRKNILEKFNKAIIESNEAYTHCEKVYLAVVTTTSLVDMINCYGNAKMDIFVKYKLNSREIINIIKNEWKDEKAIFYKITETAILGRDLNSNKVKNALDEISQRTYRQLNEAINNLIDESIKYADEKIAKESEEEKNKGNRVMSGTAFFINSNGNILTNNHVVKQCSSDPRIIYNKKDYTAKIIAKDGNLDLALLKSDAKPKNYLNISKDNVNKLENIYVAGYPLGKGLSDDLKFTQGIVSSIKGYQDNSNEIQIDAALNPGNSGGPIVNSAGQLVAVAVSGITKAQNVNFGIKSKAVLDFLNTNSVKVSPGIFNFNKSNSSLQKLLEESTVYIYCR
jgi:V8-like Glu-specific endopeptidase